MEVVKKPWSPTQMICLNNAQTQAVFAMGSNFLPIQISNQGYKALVDEKSEIFSKSHTQLVMALAFSNDDKLLLTGSEDKSLKVWDTSNWTLLYTIPCNKKATSAGMIGDSILWSDRSGAVFETSLQKLQSASEKGAKETSLLPIEVEGVKKEENEDKKENADDVDEENSNSSISLILGHCSWVTTMFLNNSFIATGDRDKKIRISNYPKAYDILSYCLGQPTFISCIALLPSRVLVSAGGDGMLYSWNYTTGKMIHKLAIATGVVRSIVVVDNELLAVVVEGDSSVHFVSYQANGDVFTYITKIPITTQMILSLSIHRTSTSKIQFFVSTTDIGVQIFDLEKSNSIPSLTSTRVEEKEKQLVSIFDTFFDPQPTDQTYFDALKKQFSLTVLLVDNFDPQLRRDTAKIEGGADNDDNKQKKKKRKGGGKANHQVV
jgi:WD40 repeat protein